jgi:hypothetical protein
MQTLRSILPRCHFLLLLGAVALPAAGQSPTIDGQLDSAFYGTPISVQNTPTTFGNATNGHPRFAVQGSELDAAYARVSDGYLFLFIAGNLETYGQGLTWSPGNQNKLDIFVDSIPGGQGDQGSGLRGDNAEVDGGALAAMGHVDSTNDGLKFDSGFDADFYITFYNHTEVVSAYPSNVEAWRGKLYYATLPTGGSGTAQTLGVAQDVSNSSFTPTFTFTNGVQLGFNNSNTGGVWGTNDVHAADTSLATNVTTGLELAIPIQFLSAADGSINENIRIIAFVNDINHRYMSNQVLGPMGQTAGGYGNLGDPRLLNFSAAYSPGDQFFTSANPYSSARALLVPDFGPNGTMTNHWLGAVGHVYVLQANTNLLSTNWVAVSGSVTSGVPTLSVVVTNSAPYNYYRSVRID